MNYTNNHECFFSYFRHLRLRDSACSLISMNRGSGRGYPSPSIQFHRQPPEPIYTRCHRFEIELHLSIDQRKWGQTSFFLFQGQYSEFQADHTCSHSNLEIFFFLWTEINAEQVNAFLFSKVFLLVIFSGSALTLFTLFLSDEVSPVKMVLYRYGVNIHDIFSTVMTVSFIQVLTLYFLYRFWLYQIRNFGNTILNLPDPFLLIISTLSPCLISRLISFSAQNFLRLVSSLLGARGCSNLWLVPLILCAITSRRVVYFSWRWCQMIYF